MKLVTQVSHNQVFKLRTSIRWDSVSSPPCHARPKSSDQSVLNQNCHLAGSSKKQESSRKTSTSALLTTEKHLTVWITTNWKILKEMGIPDHLTCLLRNLYAGLEATVRTGHGTTDWFQIEKGVCQGGVLSPCLSILYAEYIMWNARLEEAQARIKIAGEISITSDMQLPPSLWQKAKKN